jgi:hypothetical protein
MRASSAQDNPLDWFSAPWATLAMSMKDHQLLLIVAGCSVHVAIGTECGPSFLDRGVERRNDGSPELGDLTSGERHGGTGGQDPRRK